MTIDEAMTPETDRRQMEVPREDGPEAMFRFGTALLNQGQPAAALNYLARAHALAPAVTAVHNNLAMALLQVGDPNAALEIVDKGLRLEPDHPQLHNAAGNVYLALDRHEDAALHFERAWRLAPGNDTFAINHADALVGLGRMVEASPIFDAIVDRRPGSAAFVARANLARKLGRTQAAEADFHRALELEPGDKAALNGLGILQMDRGRWHAALATFQDLASLHPSSPEAQANLGQALQALGRQDEAVAAFDRALALHPEHDAILPFLMQSLLYQCDWDRLEAIETAVLAGLERQLALGQPVATPPFVLAATRASAGLRSKAAKAYSAQHCLRAGHGVAHPTPLTHQRERQGKLRVGFISPDFRSHSVGIAMADLISAFDRDRFHWIAYSTSRDADDDLTGHFRDNFDAFKDLAGAAAFDAARAIHGDGVDVMVDLAGHTRNTGLDVLAWKPAPVQAHYLGYGNTLGADWVPYLITDGAHTPPELAPQCSEAMVYLPDSFMAASRHPIADAPCRRADHGLPQAGIVFANFNAHYKIHPRVFDLWLRLLRRIPASVLWLSSGTDVAEANLRAEAERCSVDPARLVFAERLPHAEHLARHGLADLALDTWPHAGGVTTSDALWAGVPVLTLAGEAHGARTGASILTAADLPDLIVDSLPAYEAAAYELAVSPRRVAALKARVTRANQTAALFQPERLARHLERAFEMMWQRWADGLSPADIHVPPID